MGVEVKLTLNDMTEVEVAAAVRRGLSAGGKAILAISDAGAPVEPEPRHGVHGIETGFTRLEVAGDDDRVAIGYNAFWMVFQHENLEYNHPHGGHAKFLEMAVTEGGDAALEAVAAQLREVFG